MLKALFHLSLAVLLLLQSTVGVADAHQFHQSSNQHQEMVDHDHKDTEVMDSINDSIDCHHCCHCHGSSGSASTVSIIHLCVFSSHSFTSSNRCEYSSNPLSSLYRPPIV